MKVELRTAAYVNLHNQGTHLSRNGYGERQMDGGLYTLLFEDQNEGPKETIHIQIHTPTGIRARGLKNQHQQQKGCIYYFLCLF